MLLITDELVKSPISPPLAGGDKGEGEFLTFHKTVKGILS